MTTRARRLATALVAGLVALSLAGCGTPLTGTDVLDTGIEPVPLRFDAPTYAAAVDGEMHVRSGRTRSAPGAFDVRWLPDGTALAHVPGRALTLRVVDPGAGPVGPRLRTTGFEMPSRAVTQVNVLDQETTPPTLTAYSLDLEELWRLQLPETDNPDAADPWNELHRNYYGAVATIDGATFVLWHDGSEWYEDGDYGLARIEDGEVTNSAINERLVALFLAADGSGLLALRQSRGDPCGGCSVDQEVVEIDPRTGELIEYGVPDGYREEWRVDAMDKVGDRVAVRFVDRRSGGPSRLIGTYVLEDGEWSLLPGSDQEVTWWQGEGRVVVRGGLAPTAGDLVWVRDGREVDLDGVLLDGSGRRLLHGSVAGQLLPPE